jgi:hypothetical protein
MADKDLEVQVRSVMIASPVLKSLLAKGTDGQPAVHPDSFSPIGKLFPQLCFKFIEGASEEVLPSKNGSLVFTVYVQRGTQEPLRTMKRIAAEIEKCINKRPQVLTDIPNRLRVVRCVKNGKDSGYDEGPELFETSITFDIVMSDEWADYTKHYGDDPQWP